MGERSCGVAVRAGERDRAAFDFDSSKHPRAADGRFGPDGGTGETPVAIPEAVAKADAADYAARGTRAKAFKQWFGDWEAAPADASKVVDAAGAPKETHGISGVASRVMRDGKPVVVYHGTATGGFDRFRKDKDKGENLFGPGFYFTEDPGIAAEYTEKDRPHELDRPFAAKDAKRAAKFLGGRKVRSLVEADPTARAGYKRLSVASEGTPEAFGKAIASEGGELGDFVRKSLGIGIRPAGTPEVKAVYLNIREPADMEGPMTPEVADRIAKAVDAKWETTPFPSGLTVGDYLRGAAIRKGESIEAAMNRVSANIATASGTTSVSDGVGGSREARTTLPFRKQDYQSLLAAAGFDGMTHTGGTIAGGGSHLHKVWIAFEPTQIKGVGNAGTFDPNDPRIDFGGGPVADRFPFAPHCPSHPDSPLADFWGGKVRVAGQTYSRRAVAEALLAGGRSLAEVVGLLLGGVASASRNPSPFVRDGDAFWDAPVRFGSRCGTRREVAARLASRGTPVRQIVDMLFDAIAEGLAG